MIVRWIRAFTVVRALTWWPGSRVTVRTAGQVRRADNWWRNVTPRHAVTKQRVSTPSIAYFAGTNMQYLILCNKHPLSYKTPCIFLLNILW